MTTPRVCSVCGAVWGPGHPAACPSTTGTGWVTAPTVAHMAQDLWQLLGDVGTEPMQPTDLATVLVAAHPAYTDAQADLVPSAVQGLEVMQALADADPVLGARFVAVMPMQMLHTVCAMVLARHHRQVPDGPEGVATWLAQALTDAQGVTQWQSG